MRALALYLRTPFGRLHSRNPEVVALAEALGRSAGSVALKLVNLVACDATVDRKGMANASALDREVWTDFLRDPLGTLASVSGGAPADAPPAAAARRFAFPEAAPGPGLREGLDVPAAATARRGQDLFRDWVLAAYDGRCAVTRLDDPRLLTASHVEGWAEAPAHRLDPSNGLCLNALHDRAFDRALISFDADWRVMVSDRLAPEARAWFKRPEHERLRLPARFRPCPERMARHRARFLAA